MREPRKRRRRVLVLLGVLAIGAGTTGVVRALWSASGTGSGSSRAVTAQAITIQAAASPTADLYPGASGTLQFSVDNPNPYPVNLTSVDYGSVSSSDATNCPATNVSVAADGALGTPIAIAAEASGQAATISGAVTMVSGAPDGCQGVTFTVAITLTGTQT